eukprot:5017815-Pleurochrysis_carterae.AAC.1
MLRASPCSMDNDETTTDPDAGRPGPTNSHVFAQPSELAGKDGRGGYVRKSEDGTTKGIRSSWL